MSESIEVHLSGDWVYVRANGGLYVYIVNYDGSLTLLQGPVDE